MCISTNKIKSLGILHTEILGGHTGKAGNGNEMETGNGNRETENKNGNATS